jgi:hypothetical protein
MRGSDYDSYFAMYIWSRVAGIAVVVVVVGVVAFFVGRSSV